MQLCMALDSTQCKCFPSRLSKTDFAARNMPSFAKSIRLREGISQDRNWSETGRDTRLRRGNLPLGRQSCLGRADRATVGRGAGADHPPSCQPGGWRCRSPLQSYPLSIQNLLEYLDRPLLPFFPLLFRQESLAAKKRGLHYSY